MFPQSIFCCLLDHVQAGIDIDKDLKENRQVSTTGDAILKLTEQDFAYEEFMTIVCKIDDDRRAGKPVLHDLPALYAWEPELPSTIALHVMQVLILRDEGRPKRQQRLLSEQIRLGKQFAEAETQLFGEAVTTLNAVANLIEVGQFLLSDH